MEKYTNTGCPIYGTKYCKALNMPGCNKCAVSGGDMETIKADLDAIEELLPEGGMGQFYTGGRCMLCKGEKAPAEWFGMADLGNPKPHKTGANAIGIKTKLKAGSIVTLQLSSCAACRKKHSALSGKENLYTIMVAALLLALFNFVPVMEGLSAIASFLPLLLFIVAVAGVWVLGRLHRKKLMEKYRGETYLNIFDIPGVDEMAEKGWFEINPYKDMSKVLFSREPLKQGLFTGEEVQRDGDGENIAP